MGLIEWRIAEEGTREDTLYRYPLTVLDHASRYLLWCKGLRQPSTAAVYYSFHPLGTLDERTLTITSARQWHQPETPQAM